MRLIYDCQLIKCIPPKEACIDWDKFNPHYFGDGYEYAAGWRDFDSLGISVICCEDVDSDCRYFFPTFLTRTKSGMWLISLDFWKR